MAYRWPPLRRQTRPPPTGVTLVETSLTLALLALLAGLAAPGLRPLLDRWRVQQSLAALTATLQLARSEAIQRGGLVVLRPHQTDGCTLAATAADWGCGWQVFIDRNGNRRLDAGEELRQSLHIPAGVRVAHGNGAAAIGIDRWGKMDGLNAKRFVVYPAADGLASPATRSLCVSAGGRIRTSEGARC